MPVVSRFSPCPRLQGLAVGPILGQHQPLPVLQHCWRHRPFLGPEFPQKQPKRIRLAHAQLPGQGTWQWADVHAACPWACLRVTPGFLGQRGPAGPGVAPCQHCLSPCHAPLPCQLCPPGPISQPCSPGALISLRPNPGLGPRSPRHSPSVPPAAEHAAVENILSGIIRSLGAEQRLVLFKHTGTGSLNCLAL